MTGENLVAGIEQEEDGIEEVCHVKNTGRCKELLTDRATIYVQHHDDNKRKTKYSLIAVEKGNLLINMDSQIPNNVFYEWVKNNDFFKSHYFFLVQIYFVLFLAILRRL